MKVSFVGSLSEIFLLSLPRRTDERILTQLTNTAARRSLNHAHLFAMLSVCCLDIPSFQFGTSLRSFWNIMSTFLPLDMVYASSYIFSKFSIITGHMSSHNWPKYSRLASSNILRLSIYD